jgi:hypothetical protein
MDSVTAAPIALFTCVQDSVARHFLRGRDDMGNAAPSDMRSVDPSAAP